MAYQEQQQQNGQPEAYTQADSGSESEKALLKVWQERRRQAANARSAYEGVWKLCQNYIAGKQWVGLSKDRDNRVFRLDETSEWKDRVMITVNVLTRYVWTATGKIVADELRPDFTFLQEDEAARQYCSQANAAWRYGYECEIHGDRAIKAALNKTLTYGTSALQARYDFGSGRVLATLPTGEDGNTPISYNLEEAHSVVAESHDQGLYLPTRDIREGTLTWDAYGPWGILPPPGIEDEKDFPWIILCRAYDLEALRMIYPEAQGLQEESIRNPGGLQSMSSADPATDSGRLKGHTMLYSGFCRPTNEHPDGYVLHWTQDRVMEMVPSLPYEKAGVRKAGIVFLKWHSVADRWWAQGMIEPGLGPQFELNRSVSQDVEMKDRNLGRVYVTKGTITSINRPQGAVMEVVELAPGAAPPVETSGVNNPNLQAQTEMMKVHISDTMGMGATSLGQAPRGVTAYSAFAFMVEQDDKDLIVAAQDIRDKVAELAHYSIQDIRNYKGPEWQVMIAGAENQMQSFLFNAMRMPAEYVIQAKKTVSIPKAQSAELQKIFDIFDRSVSSGRPLPLDWLYESLEAGRALPLPKSQDATQRQKAELENALLVQGMMIPPSPEDDDESHVNVHVAAKSALMYTPTGAQAVAALDQHIQMHIMSAQQKMRASALATQEAAGEGPKAQNQSAQAGAAQPQVA